MKIFYDTDEADANLMIRFAIQSMGASGYRPVSA